MEYGAAGIISPQANLDTYIARHKALGQLQPPSFPKFPFLLVSKVVAIRRRDSVGRVQTRRVEALLPSKLGGTGMSTAAWHSMRRRETNRPRPPVKGKMAMGRSGA